MNINVSNYMTFVEAWRGINETMANNEKSIKEKGGGMYSTEMVSYDNVIHIDKNYFDPNFDFGRILGYRYKKWSKLVNNYVNMNYLDLVKSEVLAREKKVSKHYTFTFHFDNSHGSGKDCLISLTFSRRRGKKIPTVIYTTRASEVTSRLIFDFLLIQRLVEYVYGVGVSVEVICYIPFMFLHIERFAIYMGTYGTKVLKGNDSFQEKCRASYKKFTTTDPETIKYKVHKRTALQLQMDDKGYPLSGAPKLLAKDLKLIFNPKLKDKEIAKLNNSVTI